MCMCDMRGGFVRLRRCTCIRSTPFAGTRWRSCLEKSLVCVGWEQGLFGCVLLMVICFMKLSQIFAGSDFVGS